MCGWKVVVGWIDQLNVGSPLRGFDQSFKVGGCWASVPRPGLPKCGWNWNPESRGTLRHVSWIYWLTSRGINSGDLNGELR